MLSSSPLITLRRNSSGSRNAGDRRAARRPGVDRLDVAHRPGRAGCRPWRRPARDCARPARRRPSGTRSRPRTAASAGRPGRARRSAARSWGRQSFWLTSRAVPSSTTSAESPPGPSVMLTSRRGWRRSRPSTERDRLAVACATKRREAEPAQLALRARRSGSRAAAPWRRGRRARPATPRRGGRRGGGRCTGSRVLDPCPQLVGDSWSLRGNTNHDPKNAGTNHGSHRIEPWSVSIRMPAWPIEVILTETVWSPAGDAAQATGGSVNC